MNKNIYSKDEYLNLDVKKDEVVNIYHFIYNSSCQVNINMIGKNAKVYYYLSALNRDDNNCHIQINHLQSQTESYITTHGVNACDNKLLFDVTSVVPKTSFKCICNQDNMIVNVTNGVSKIMPKLLIENYDTSSAHSAYIGGFKDEALFYLASRGISYEVAFEMLIQGFLLNEANKDEKIVQNLLSKVGDVKWIK